MFNIALWLENFWFLPLFFPLNRTTGLRAVISPEESTKESNDLSKYLLNPGINQMATFSETKHHQPSSQRHTLPIQLEFQESEQQDGPIVTSVSPHLRHGHHHHSDPGPSNFSSLVQRSVMEALGNNSHHPKSTHFDSDNFTFPFGNNGNFTSAAATFVTSGEDGMMESQSSHIVKMLTPSESSFPLNMSVSEEDFPISYDNSSLLANTSISIIGNLTKTSVGPPSFIASLYAIIVPVMIFFCALTCIVNLVIVLSARWCRKPMSPTLYYSISLALADAYASFILGVGLTINSLLPHVYNIQLTECLSLTIEAFR